MGNLKYIGFSLAIAVSLGFSGCASKASEVLPTAVNSNIYLNMNCTQFKKYYYELEYDLLNTNEAVDFIAEFDSSHVMILLLAPIFTPFYPPLGNGVFHNELGILKGDYEAIKNSKQYDSCITKGNII